MKILDYLWYHYYRFQIKVGNSDVAEIMSVLFMAFILQNYFFGTYLILLFKFKIVLITLTKVRVVIFYLSYVLLLLLYIFYGKRYKKIENNYSKSNTNSLYAIIFAIGSFCMLFLGIFIMVMIANKQL